MLKVDVKRKINKKVVFGLHKGSEEGLEKALNLLQTSVKALAPVDTGQLRSSIEKKLVSRDEGKVYTVTEYALFQEEGTSKMSAANQGKGYFRIGLEQVLDRMYRIYNAAVRRGLRDK